MPYVNPITDEVRAIIATAPKFQEQPPPPVAALRVAKIEGPFNPSRSSYAYDQSWRITFENGLQCTIGNDRVAGMCHAKVGGYYVFGEDVLWFYDEETFKAKFRPV